MEIQGSRKLFRPTESTLSFLLESKLVDPNRFRELWDLDLSEFIHFTENDLDDYQKLFPSLMTPLQWLRKRLSFRAFLPTAKITLQLMFNITADIDGVAKILSEADIHVRRGNRYMNLSQFDVFSETRSNITKLGLEILDVSPETLCERVKKLKGCLIHYIDSGKNLNTSDLNRVYNIISALYGSADALVLTQTVFLNLHLEVNDERSRDEVTQPLMSIMKKTVFVRLHIQKTEFVMDVLKHMIFELIPQEETYYDTFEKLSVIDQFYKWNLIFLSLSEVESPFWTKGLSFGQCEVIRHMHYFVLSQHSTNIK